MEIITLLDSFKMHIKLSKSVSVNYECAMGVKLNIIEICFLYVLRYYYISVPYSQWPLEHHINIMQIYNTNQLAHSSFGA